MFFYETLFTDANYFTESFFLHVIYELVNYAFCVAIAIMYKGEIIGGGVGLPWKEKSIIYAIKDEGITSNFLQENFQ